MSHPTRVDHLTIRHHDDTTTEHGHGIDTAIGYYAHRHGLDVVNADGTYVARYNPHQFLDYTAYTLATTAAT